MWNNTKEHQLGAIVGALVGDAAGATLEFYKKPIDLAAVTQAMRMPGGGALNVAPGQVTDDGELTLALISALQKHKPHTNYPVRDVASAYVDWMSSEPFDSGFTCRQAFVALREGPTIKDALTRIQTVNCLSEANGALMRATPIGTFYHELPYATVCAYAKMDARLSHPNQICQDANALYSVAIADLINYQRDNIGAMTTVEEMADKLNVHPNVRQWLKDSERPLTDIVCSDNIGHVKHAFTLAFHFLRKGVSFEEAIEQTLLKGGDTDTNACIVGGLMGALHGFTSIPEEMRDAVLDFDCVKHDSWQTLMGHNRPHNYKAMVAYDFVMSL